MNPSSYASHHYHFLRWLRPFCPFRPFPGLFHSIELHSAMPQHDQRTPYSKFIGPMRLLFEFSFSSVSGYGPRIAAVAVYPVLAIRAKPFRRRRREYAG